MRYCVKRVDNGYSVERYTADDDAIFTGDLIDCIDYVREVLKNDR